MEVALMGTDTGLKWIHAVRFLAFYIKFFSIKWGMEIEKLQHL